MHMYGPLHDNLINHKIFSYNNSILLCLLNYDTFVFPICVNFILLANVSAHPISLQSRL